MLIRNAAPRGGLPGRRRQEPAAATGGATKRSLHDSLWECLIDCPTFRRHERPTHDLGDLPARSVGPWAEVGAADRGDTGFGGRAAGITADNAAAVSRLYEHIEGGVAGYVFKCPRGGANQRPRSGHGDDLRQLAAGYLGVRPEVGARLGVARLVGGAATIA